MASPLVSVLVPCHNAAPWLAKALGSALDQTWPRLEVIVVDDGSTDASRSVARRFASSRCRVFHQDNRGASAARNRALSLAQGEVIQYLDADDFLAPDKIERQLAALEKNRLSWGTVVHLLDGTTHGPGKAGKARLAPSNRADPVGFLVDLWGGNGNPGMVALHQWLTPRHLLVEAGPWNESLTVDDDGEFFARVVLASAGLVHVPESTCFYRKFRAGRNQSTAIFRHPRHRRSAMEAAQLKAGHLLARCDSAQARRAVSRLITGEIVTAYPDHDDLVQSGRHFLRARDLPLAREIGGSPWFRRARACLGWKAARRLQNRFRAGRRAELPRDSISWTKSRATEAGEGSGDWSWSSWTDPHPDR